MKLTKFGKYCTLALAPFVIGSLNVDASELTGLYANDSLGLGTFEAGYDATNDLNTMKVTITLTEEKIETVLAQKNGSASSLAPIGTYYFNLFPELEGEGIKFQKMYMTPTDDLDSDKAYLQAEALEEPIVSYSTVWPMEMKIEYHNGTEWTAMTGSSDGSKSTRDYLLEALGLEATPEKLVYGENYRFYVPIDKKMLWTFNIYENDVKTDKYEYVMIDYEVDFPITGIEDNKGVYYPSLSLALASKDKKILINEDMVIDTDTTIPEGVTLVIAEDVTVTLEEGVTLTNNGIIENVENIDGYTIPRTIKVEATNGTVTFDGTPVKGDEVKLTITPVEGYELKTIKVMNVTDNIEIELKGDSFIMPDGDVEITAEFVKKADPVDPIIPDLNESPKTADPTIAYIALGGVSTIGLFTSASKIKRRKK